MDPQLQQQLQPGTLVEHNALTLLLQHPSVLQDLQLMCSLLCVCKGMRISVAQQCRQQLAPECTVTQALPKVANFAAWLRRWAGLAKTLELNWDRMALPDVEGLLSEALTAAAVPDAAADVACAGGRNGLDTCTGPLRVQSLKANVAGPLLLGQLPASTLTCLELGHVNDYPCEWLLMNQSAWLALKPVAALQGTAVLLLCVHSKSPVLLLLLLQAMRQLPQHWPV